MGAAEACSFTDAGRQLGLSSSAVGKCVARLEQWLNVPLFNRNTRCINPTHEGKAFLQTCRGRLMTHSYDELVIGGVLVAPFISYAVAALFVILIIRPILHLLGFSRIFSHPSIAESASM
jgi:hypothetical protein